MTEDKAATSGIFPRWFPSSLRRRLLLGVLAVVSVVLVTVGIVSVLSLRGYVNAMSDADIAESLDAFSHQYTKYRNGEHTSTHPGTPPIGQAMLEFTGQTPGNLIAVLRNGVVIRSAVFSEGEPKPAPADVISALEGQTWSGGPPGPKYWAGSGLIASTAPWTAPTCSWSGCRRTSPTGSSRASRSPRSR